MLQYKYFHKSSGYELKLSIPEKNDEYILKKNVFETLRKNTGDKAFVYATMNDNTYYLLQQFSCENAFVHGLSDTNIANPPHKYFRLLDTAPKETDFNDDILHPGVLPQISSRVDDFSIARELDKNLFANIIDAILFENKPILINIEDDDNYSKTIKYLKVIYLLLPLNYMKNKGIMIGSNKIPDSLPFKVTDNEGYEKDLNIRLIFQNIKSFDFYSYSSSYIIFDSINDKNNYEKELSAFSNIIASSLYETNKINDLANRIRSLFSNDGQIDLNGLEKLCILFDFNNNPNETNAVKIINLFKDNKNAIDKNIVINALNIILNSHNSLNKQLLLEMCRYDEDIEVNFKEELVSQFIVDYKKLNKIDKDYIMHCILIDINANTYSNIMNLFLGSYDSLIDAFEISLEIFKHLIEVKGMQIYDILPILDVFIEVFDISAYRRLVPGNCKTEGEPLFKLLNTCNNELKMILTASLFISVYSKELDNDLTTIRISGLKLLLSNLNEYDKILFIVELRNKILDLASLLNNEFNKYEIDSQFGFILDNNVGSRWILPIVDKFEIGELINLHSEITKHAVRQYSQLLEIISTKLLDLGYVKASLNSNIDIQDKYATFFYGLPDSMIEEHEDIKEYLDNTISKNRISEELLKFRYEFSKKCFNYMSSENQAKVKSMPGVGDKLYDVRKEIPEKLKIVEATIDVFGMTKNETIKNKKKFSFKKFFGLFNAFVIIALLLVPVLVRLKVINGNFVDLYLEFFKPYYYGLPIYGFLTFLTPYMLLKGGNRFARSFIISIFLSIIPTLLFVSGYITFYFIGIV